MKLRYKHDFVRVSDDPVNEVSASPCTRLLAAVIQMAVRDAIGIETVEKGESARVKREARLWLSWDKEITEGDPDPFTFSWMAMHLGIDPEALRIAIKQFVADRSHLPGWYFKASYSTPPTIKKKLRAA